MKQRLKRQQKGSMKLRAGFGKLNKIDKTLARIIKKKKWTRINKTRNEELQNMSPKVLTFWYKRQKKWQQRPHFLDFKGGHGGSTASYENNAERRRKISFLGWQLFSKIVGSLQATRSQTAWHNYDSGLTDLSPDQEIFKLDIWEESGEEPI